MLPAGERELRKMMETKKNIYLDYNATTPARPEITEAMLRVMQQPVNASSVHAFGREAKKQVEDARKAVAALVKASDAYQVVFTATGTEANNLALHGFPPQVVRIVSAVEHASVIKAHKE